MIRPATLADYPKLIPLFQQALDNSPFTNKKLDLLHIQRLITVALATPNFFCEVVEVDGEITGVLGGSIYRNAWGALVASDIIFYATGGSGSLLRHFKAWAKSMDAEAIIVTDLSGNRRFNKLINCLGLSPVGKTFARIW